MAVARAKGLLKGRRPKLTVKQQKELRRMHGTGHYTVTDLAEPFKVSRPCTEPFNANLTRKHVEAMSDPDSG
jgi:Helix-turn-helix domain of resolvase